MSINQTCYDLLEKIVNMDKVSFNLCNGLLGYGANCNANSYPSALQTITQFLNDKGFNDEDKLKYINAFQYGFMLSTK